MQERGGMRYPPSLWLTDKYLNTITSNSKFLTTKVSNTENRLMRYKNKLMHIITHKICINLFSICFNLHQFATIFILIIFFQ